MSTNVHYTHNAYSLVGETNIDPIILQIKNLDSKIMERYKMGESETTTVGFDFRSVSNLIQALLSSRQVSPFLWI